MLINYKPTAKNQWDIRVDGEKVGQVFKYGAAKLPENLRWNLLSHGGRLSIERGTFIAALTRSVPHALEAICGPRSFVAELNAQR
jgi:hypothetical protein